LRYSSKKKDYKCYDPVNKKIINKNMTLLENVPYYKIEKNDRKEKKIPRFDNFYEVSENSNEEVEENLDVSEIKSEEDMGLIHL
jgi:hypothetical protein